MQDEFNPELIYIKDSKNIVVVTLSRLDKIKNVNNNNNKIELTLESLNENFVLNNKDVLPPTNFNIRFQQIKDESLIEIAPISTPLNIFMGQVRCIILYVDTENL